MYICYICMYKLIRWQKKVVVAKRQPCGVACALAESLSFLGRICGLRSYHPHTLFACFVIDICTALLLTCHITVYFIIRCLVLSRRSINKLSQSTLVNPCSDSLSIAGCHQQRLPTAAKMTSVLVQITTKLRQARDEHSLTKGTNCAVVGDYALLGNKRSQEEEI